MNPKQAIQLANLLRKHRVKLGLSANEVARRAGVNVATVTRIELAQISKPQPETLLALADVLGVEPSDIFAITGWAPAEQLPPLRPYLRRKYQELPDDAVAEVEQLISELQRKHAGPGPTNREDET